MNHFSYYSDSFDARNFYDGLPHLYTTIFNMTPLMYACIHDHQKAVDLIVNAPLDPKSQLDMSLQG